MNDKPMNEIEALGRAIEWGKSKCATYQHNRYVFDRTYIEPDEQALNVLRGMLADLNVAANVKAALARAHAGTNDKARER